MLCGALLLLALPPTTAEMRILFLGNSHTAANNLPLMVERLIESDGSGNTAVVDSRFMGFLEDYAQNNEVKQQLASRRWNVTVLQGLKLSSSHKYTYPHDGAIEIARLAKRSGAKPVYFAEWPRRGWDETDFILGSYAPVARLTQSEVARVPVAWDLLLSKRPNLPMWAGDGNHAQELGSYLAALTIYFTLCGSERTPRWRPNQLDDRTADLFVKSAREASRDSQIAPAAGAGGPKD